MGVFALLGLLLIFPAAFVRAQSDVKELSQALSANPRVETVLPLLPKISQVLRDDDTALEALPMAEQAAEFLLSSASGQGHWQATASLLKAVARLRFDQAEPDRAARHLRSLRDLYRSLEGPSPGSGQQRSRWNYEIAVEYLRGGQVNEALEILGEAMDRDTGTPAGFDDLRAAAADALNRRLEQLTTNQRYELLYAWTLPSDGRRTVRVMTSLASAEAPPDVFARAIGERPRAGSFPVPNVGGVDGLFSTAWLLVHAAGESGRLRRLIAELEDLAKADVPHAGPLLLLARIADHSASSDELRNLINKQLTPSPSEQTNDMLDWALAGAACLDRADLLAAGQQIFETMLERIGPAPSQHALPFLRRARAIAIFKQHDDAGPALLWDPGLKFWIPAGEENAVRSATGAVHEIWLAHEGHIVHVAGPRNDYLCFRYPLAGTFEFQVEAQTGGKEATCGNIAFGGLAYGVDGNGNEFRVWGLDMGQMIARPFPYVRKEQSPTYQRLILRSSETGVEYLMNGHPVWTDSLLNTPSPWLALRAFGDCIPAFRNLRLTGNPVIPREVRMSDGDSMRGWLTQFYTCKASRAVPVDDVNTIINPPPQQADQPGANAPPDKAQFDWFMHNGVIHGAKRDESFRAAAQSRLTYFRPLQDGESIRYEFLYEPGKHEVHPALGRLAFLIEPVGVRVHWLTGGETDWTGLPENNATIEPLNRRGPRILPLNPGQWNRLTVALGDNTLRLMLNDVECYSRNMEAENSRRFSLYYDRSRSAAQVRDVVLHGDWPEQLTAEERSDLLAPRQTVD